MSKEDNGYTKVSQALKMLKAVAALCAENKRLRKLLLQRDRRKGQR